MDNWLDLVIDLIIILIFLGGFTRFRTPKGARAGNFSAAFALALAVIVVIIRHRIMQPHIVMIALLIGSAAGWYVASRVKMIQIPAMVAFQHGAGGIAAFLVSFIELTRNTLPGFGIEKISGLLGLTIGALTFSGSMIASGKLGNVIRKPPVTLPGHSLITTGLLILIIITGFFTGYPREGWLTFVLIVMVVESILLGLVFSIRIGGADMPVLISFLNATAGLAAAFCGVIIHNRLLIACGATVAASGSILTHVMCKAMNRNLLQVFIGFKVRDTKDPVSEFLNLEDVSDRQVDVQNHLSPEKPAITDPLAEATEVCRNAKKIIFVPGYGMAFAQAQFDVVKFATMLEESGKDVKFAIHPVAGRMPGHMDVLLAEAELSYDKLIEMDDINPEFEKTDVAIIVGACDVVNPAAITQKNTPISGMPILLAHMAKRVLVCNLDDKPGYSGIDNPLYKNEKVIMLLGDAKETLGELITRYSGSEN
ncbi:MAG TPA: NAD(P)(+) transhydrogenase (Re/Si-specific) subunit beta [Prolixibacteraceae bacterium]|nr:NAD(P)(+) transhydrogenase (Re/Si-specific) subunit beta [Prolixibacteraceae bacterium]HQE51096.1 NAD(P)(+) transhydrogenase (Re/Si-specific) subunit beta [Prolixibacteraceae bacterium]HQH75138.1 NAD(P)(+) transhydrogenase (Re/Si-specific) subunit beta [Prolixibacteraceae bacterium]HQJ85916.1 NAD(P)(+) transhydrogenase (Re/Si-specific) subunit beta [Prolixibacteraceae bacterium]